MSEILRTEHIVQRCGGMESLKDISMRVESGEIVGVIGPNGAGKTTLFNCITGMYCPTAASYTHLTLPTILRV